MAGRPVVDSIIELVGLAAGIAPSSIGWFAGCYTGAVTLGLRIFSVREIYPESQPFGPHVLTLADLHHDCVGS